MDMDHKDVMDNVIMILAAVIAVLLIGGWL